MVFESRVYGDTAGSNSNGTYDPVDQPVVFNPATTLETVTVYVLDAGTYSLTVGGVAFGAAVVSVGMEEITFTDSMAVGPTALTFSLSEAGGAVRTRYLTPGTVTLGDGTIVAGNWDYPASYHLPWAYGILVDMSPLAGVAIDAFAVGASPFARSAVMFPDPYLTGGSTAYERPTTGRVYPAPNVYN